MGEIAITGYLYDALAEDTDPQYVRPLPENVEIDAWTLADYPDLKQVAGLAIGIRVKADSPNEDDDTCYALEITEDDLRKALRDIEDFRVSGFSDEGDEEDWDPFGDPEVTV